jgi:hypothetical protein
MVQIRLCLSHQDFGICLLCYGVVIRCSELVWPRFRTSLLTGELELLVRQALSDNLFSPKRVEIGLIDRPSVEFATTLDEPSTCHTRESECRKEPGLAAYGVNLPGL